MPYLCDFQPVLLCRGHEILISRKTRAMLLRKYTSNPAGMTRELVKEPLGEKNLALLRPRNHGKSEYRPIPPTIMAAVDGKHCIQQYDSYVFYHLELSSNSCLSFLQLLLWLIQNF